MEQADINNNDEEEGEDEEGTGNWMVHLTASNGVPMN